MQVAVRRHQQKRAARLSDQQINLSQLESRLWESADILRGPVNAVDFRTYIFPLPCFKCICDVWDEILRLVCFPGWQGAQAGEREEKKAPRKALFKYKLHADDELFEKAYSYTRKCY